MLINLWYVAEWSNKVGKDPVRVKLLGQQFVLFRDADGRAHCLSDTCSFMRRLYASAGRRLARQSCARRSLIQGCRSALAG